MKEDVHLVFQFEDQYGKVSSTAFIKPIQILTTDDHKEVEGIFRKVDALLEQGFYAAGFVSYEAAPAFDPSLHVHDEPTWPLLWFGIFEEPVPYKEKEIGGFSVSDWKIKGEFNHYQEGIQRIKQGIEKGETYQVNYTTSLEADFSGDDYAFYKQLVKNQQASYSAYLKIGQKRILSASPELFFRKTGESIVTKPMKGTASRGRFLKEDREQMDHLRHSEKEQAENLMIVDLLRNDLGRIAVPGSVQVPHLFEIETYPTVHQMTSTIQAQLPEDTEMWDIFQALFPCGSITGAPKVRTMEYIKELETTPRNIYCGAIGFMTPEKDAVFNVPIRTVLIDHEKKSAIYGAGGGVTWDSTSKGEYKEVLTKAKLLTEKRPAFDLLETMRLEDGKYPLQPYHLQRARQSAEYFGIPFHQSTIERKMEEAALKGEQGLYKVRLLINEKGEPRTEVTKCEPSPEEVLCSIATHPVDINDVFLYHKTTHRKVYEAHRNPSVFSVLLWNRHEELTEFTIGNLVMKINGGYYTPPVISGLLAGTYREYLLEKGEIEEKILFKKDLEDAEEVWMINGLRGWMKVKWKQTESRRGHNETHRIL